MDFENCDAPISPLVFVIPLCRCICLLKRWQKELLKWECQVPWHTASHLKLFWSVILCVCVCVCVSLLQHLQL